MSGYAIQFAELEHCVCFLDAALSNLSVLGIERADIDAIDVAEYETEQEFTVFVNNMPDASLHDLQRLARARGISTDRPDVAGDVHTINELLERIKLVQRSELTIEGGLAILLFDARDPEYQNWYGQLLDMGCRDISVAFVTPTTDNGKMTHILRVGCTPSRFSPPSDWAQGWDGRALAFHQLRASRDCKIYLEWEYDHPVPQIERLYDHRDPHCQGIFVCADVVDTNRPLPPGNPSAQPCWLRLREEDMGEVFFGPDSTLQLKAANATARIDLKACKTPQKGLIELRVQSGCRSAIASVDSIEQEIARHQQAIDELQRDYRSAHVLRREPVYLAYVFKQTLGRESGGPPPLNPSFQRLLEQPYSHLQNLRYGFYGDPSKGSDGKETGLHVVFDTQPADYSRVWTRMADEMYIQRLDWHEWNLPMYVRHGDDLRPRLEDRALASLVRELIWDDRPFDEPVLLRMLPSNKTESTPSEKWQALFVTNTGPLTELECFRFLNDRFSAHLLEYRKDVPADLAKQLNDQAAVLSNDADALEAAIAEAVAKRIDAAEARWAEIDPRITKVVSSTQAHERAVETIESILVDFPEQWVEYVDRVLRANQDLVREKVQAVDDYRRKWLDLRMALRDNRLGLKDMQAQLKRDKARLTDKQKDLRNLDAETAELENEVAKELSATIASQREALRLFVQAKKAIADRLAGERDKIKRLKDDRVGLVERASKEKEVLGKQIRALQEKAQGMKAREAELTTLIHQVRTLVEHVATKIDSSKPSPAWVQVKGHVAADYLDVVRKLLDRS